MTAPPLGNDITRLAVLLRTEITCDPLVCFSCLVAGVRRVVAERDRQWLASEARRDAAEAQIAALETDLQAAAALLRASDCHGQCPHWRRACDAVLARPTVAALKEEPNE